jgi:voltage-gated potassium channel
MKFPKFFEGYQLFRRAYDATRHQIWISVKLLMLITVFFAILLWIGEGSKNPDFGFVDAIVWTFVKYVEDPADVTTSPVTIFGQFVGTMVGVLGIAIFAVPAGLIGSGLLEAIEDEKKEKKIEKNSILLHKRFRRISQNTSFFINENKQKVIFKHVPTYRSLAHIQAKTGMTNDEIIAAVNNCPDMRIMNMESTQRIEDNPQDKLVVVNFPLNKEYGCFIDRGSDVTIVAPTAVSQMGTGGFAYSLAAMGGFNYVSKELTPNPDDPFGFYTMKKQNLALICDDDAKKEDVESQALHFMDDLKFLKLNSEKNGRRHWFFFIMGTAKSIDCQVHFWRLATNKDNAQPAITIKDTTYRSTVLKEDEAIIHSIFQTSKSALGARDVVMRGEKQPITVCLDNTDILKGVLPSNIMCRMGGGKDCNAVTLRLGYEILVYHSSHLLIVKDLAEAIKMQIEPEHTIRDEAKKSFLKEGDGFADDFCKMDVFDQDPKRLKKMIAQESKNARARFERFDLDGNIEEKETPKK